MPAQAGPNIYFDASFGGVPLLLASISTDAGRDIAVQSPARGDKHVLQDRGRKMRSAECTVLFVDQSGLDGFTQRYEQFRKLVDAGDPQLFSHPLDGSYRARVSGLRVEASSDTLQIVCSCTFIAEDEPQTVFPVGAGTSPAAGLEAVTTATNDANTALANDGLSSAVPNNCLAAVTSWSASDVLDSQQVFLQVASLTQQISDAIDAFDLATNLDRWTSYQALVNLHYQVARAGEAATSSAAQVFDLTVAIATPLRAICAQVYGAAAAQDRADQVAKLNRVRTPGRVPAGTVLKMPAVNS